MAEQSFIGMTYVKNVLKKLPNQICDPLSLRKQLKVAF